MTTSQPNRPDRLERLVESLIRSSENLLIAAERNQTQISTLATVAQTHEERLAQHERKMAQHDALIERLDAILERLVYREGRDDGGEASQ